MDLKKYNRRSFLTVSTAGFFACQGCGARKDSDPTSNDGNSTSSSPEEKPDPNEGMSRKTILTMLDQRVDYYMNISHHCAQTCFLALSEQFGKESPEVVKALTPVPGIAETGNTCGVIIGSLMAMGLIFGRDDLADWEKYRSSLKPAGEFVGKFKARYGSLACGDIIEKEFGRRFDLLDPEQHKEFVLAGATAKCSTVTSTGARIAAEIILDYLGK
ncbi:MAG TPA: C-GCAxxG-C-C family protein [Cyclobacteriaceae bacterium]|nr:C-GCAxxG-C-C family protein [Cyclobacteriaceae bacterium]